MRLLDSKTLELHEFIGTRVPPYAILSHTWDEGEVSFQDLMSGNISGKKGYDKIKRCCDVALSDGFKYAWVDTCCIDKTSSSELSEAINSMYRWYEEAAVCYVILSDVPSDEDCHLQSSAFRASRWFTRGWTLQELIAPTSLVFYGRDWKEIGTKASLRDLISEITKIHIGILSGLEGLGGFSIAQKMSWASQRHTTRIEDLAYCLMGLFDVNMPLLYGEGTKSFFRLQEEIIRRSNDESILAWDFTDYHRSSFFATSPRNFIDAGDIVETYNRSTVHSSLTNRGLYIQASLCRNQASGSTHLLVLSCKRQGEPYNLCVPLTESSQYPGTYYRWQNSTIRTVSEWEDATLTPKSIYLYAAWDVSDFSSRRLLRTNCYIEARGLRENKIDILKIDHYSSYFRKGITDGSSFALWEWDEVESFVGGLRFCNSSGDCFDIILRNRFPSSVTAMIKGPRRASSEGPLPAYPSAYILSDAKGSDRVWWHDPSESMWIKVTIRAQQIPEGEDENDIDDCGKAFKVNIDWDEPGDSRVYEPINLKTLAISAGLLEDRSEPWSSSLAYD